METTERWLPLKHELIIDGYYLSSLGRVRYGDNEPDENFYEATNGYNFYLFRLKNSSIHQSKVQLFPIDDLLVETFIQYHPTLRNINRVKVIHVDGNTRNNVVDNLDWVEDIEEWRDIKCTDVIDGLYQASNWGNIRNKETGVILKQFVNSNGYFNVNLRLPENLIKNKSSKTHSAHRIIMKAFWCFNEDHFINHIDGNPLNNELKNLEFCDQKANTQHALLTQLKSCVPIEDLIMVKQLLMKYKYPRIVYDMIDHDRYPHLTKNVIAFIRNKRYDNRFESAGMTDIFFHPGKMTTDEIDMVRDLLFANNSNCIDAYNSIDHDKYPHISLQMVKEIKTNKYSSYARSNKYDLTKIKFDRTPRPSRFTIDEADMIRDVLMNNNGNVRQTLTYLTNILEGITINIVSDIKRGKIYKRSMKYDLETQTRYPFIKKEESA